MHSAKVGIVTEKELNPRLVFALLRRTVFIGDIIFSLMHVSVLLLCIISIFIVEIVIEMSVEKMIER